MNFVQGTFKAVSRGRVGTFFQRFPGVWISGLMSLSILIVYIPFLFGDFSLIYRRFDGPFYLYNAKTFYLIPSDHPFSPFSPSFYAGFLPLYSVLIRVMTFFTFGHYPQAMILATLVSSIGAATLLFKLLDEWKLVSSPAWTTVLFCFLPPTWLLDHSVGATEPLFFCFIFGAFLAFKRNRDWVVFLCIFLACLTRPPGFLLVPVFGILYWEQRKWRALLLLPFSLLGILGLFTYYHFVLGDFFAFFYLHLNHAYTSAQAKASALASFPLEIFRFYAQRRNFHSTELYALLYVLYLTGTLSLWKKSKELFLYCCIFFLFTSYHFAFDLARYVVPMAPFAILVGFDSILSQRYFRLVVFPFTLYLTYTLVWGILPLSVCTKETFQLILNQIQRLH